MALSEQAVRHREFSLSLEDCVILDIVIANPLSTMLRANREPKMGDSQGGGAAWAAAEVLAQNPISGYLGAIAASPSTSLRPIFEFLFNSVPEFLCAGLARVALGLQSVYPSFRLADWFTNTGTAVTNLLQDVQGCGSAVAVMPITGAVKTTWNQTWYFEAYKNWTSVGNKPFAEWDDRNGGCSLYGHFCQFFQVHWAEDMRHIPIRKIRRHGSWLDLISVMPYAIAPAKQLAIGLDPSRMESLVPSSRLL